MLLLEKLYKLGTLFVEKVCEERSTETKLTGRVLIGGSDLLDIIVEKVKEVAVDTG